ncbi:hypothetical protein [Peterkaempfera griseoplana]|uniref:hypothetical protein n=1 Tax=Peterkaempfera griseoplana TaxID=66896 RepID=UPI0012FF0E54|nr:hypothetical protein [Peterkaempfera griseoplana]
MDGIELIDRTAPVDEDPCQFQVDGLCRAPDAVESGAEPNRPEHAAHGGGGLAWAQQGDLLDRQLHVGCMAAGVDGPDHVVQRVRLQLDRLDFLNRLGRDVTSFIGCWFRDQELHR